MRPGFQDLRKQGAGGGDGEASRALPNVLVSECPAARAPEAQRSSFKLKLWFLGISPLDLKIR